jgi:hypothetical protein
MNDGKSPYDENNLSHVEIEELKRDNVRHQQHLLRIFSPDRGQIKDMDLKLISNIVKATVRVDVDQRDLNGATRSLQLHCSSSRAK